MLPTSSFSSSTSSDIFSIDLQNLPSSDAVTGIYVDSTPAIPFNKIYVFGDSLVDTGNLFNATTFIQESIALSDSDIPIIPPSPPFFEGRFSNGQIWIDNVTEELDIDLFPASQLSVISSTTDILGPVTLDIPDPIPDILGDVPLIEPNPIVSPFFNGGTVSKSVNFAYGLATTGATGTGELADFIPGVERQIDFFLEDNLLAEQAADGDALYVLWAGSNDYFVPGADPEQVVDNIETGIESLFTAGARDFLVVNLPDLGAIPEANNPNLTTSPEELSELSDTHNLLLDSNLEELEDTLTGANITVLDVNTLFDDVLANPGEFGLTNVTEPFLNPLTFTPTVGANPDEFFFFDTLHPTEAGHAIISDFALETLGINADI